MSRRGFFVVDTNVPIVTNGRAEVSGSCVLKCARQIADIIQRGKIAVDDKYLIINEYKRQLSQTGQPGLGDRFLKWVLNNQRNPRRCIWTTITPLHNENGSFKEFPNHPDLAAFDPSDRKFVAVSAANSNHPPILQATDSKWLSWNAALGECGIRVIFLCPGDITAMRKSPKGKS